MNNLTMQTKNKANENYNKLAALFPNAITETIDENGQVVRAIDKDILMQEISTTVVDGPEQRYQFMWPDKKQAILTANAPIRKTLRPCPEQSVNFDTTENLYIEGDNLDVLKLLQETYLGKVKMIYIDPPYNTGNDFVYNDEFGMRNSEFSDASGQYDNDGNMLFEMKKNNESNGRFHTDWLNMIYPRLKLARDLLTDDGVVFISIDDNEVENLKKVCSEVFGESNFIAEFVWKKKQGGGNDSNHVVVEHEYILCFCKKISDVQLNLDKNYKLSDKLYPFKDTKGEYGLITLDKSSIQFSQSLVFEITGPNGEKYMPRIVKGKQSCWRWGKNKVENEYDSLVFKNDKVYTKYYRPEGVTPKTLLIDALYGRTESGNDDIKSLFQNNPFSYPKPTLLIKHFASITLNPNDIILDFFSGSATTAHAIMKLNAEDGGHRKFIMVQLPEKTDEKSEAFKAGYETICEIGKERIRRAGAKINEELARRNEELKNEQFTLENTTPNSSFLTPNSIDVGFRVLKLDSSNMKDVYYTPNETTINLFDNLIDNIKDDRTPEDLLFQVMLELGILLSSEIEETTICGKKVFSVAGNYLMACFGNDVTDEVITQIAKQKPYYFVMRDSSMANDSVATNFEQIFQTYSADTIRRVL